MKQYVKKLEALQIIPARKWYARGTIAAKDWRPVSVAQVMRKFDPDKDGPVEDRKEEPKYKMWRTNGRYFICQVNNYDFFF